MSSPLQPARLAPQDVEIQIQVLPASMDKAWIPNIIENKLKDLLDFTVRVVGRGGVGRGDGGRGEVITAAPAWAGQWCGPNEGARAGHRCRRGGCTRESISKLGADMLTARAPSIPLGPAGGGGGCHAQGARARHASPAAVPHPSGGSRPGKLGAVGCLVTTCSWLALAV